MDTPRCLDTKPQMSSAADAKPKQLSIADLLLFQAFLAMMLAVDLWWYGSPYLSYFVLPVGLTLWVALRMQFRGDTRWLNPFVVAIGSIAVSRLTHFWAVDLRDHQTMLRMRSRGSAEIVDNVVMCVATGFLLGLLCTLLSAHVRPTDNLD